MDNELKICIELLSQMTQLLRANKANTFIHFFTNPIEIGKNQIQGSLYIVTIQLWFMSLHNQRLIDLHMLSYP